MRVSDGITAMLGRRTSHSKEEQKVCFFVASVIVGGYKLKLNVVVSCADRVGFMWS